MYSITSEIMHNNIDAYVFLYCNDFEGNLKLLEKKFNKEKSLGLKKYFGSNSSKIHKLVKDNKIFIIAKASEDGCNKSVLEDKIYKICSMLKSEEGVKNVQFILSPIKNLIEFQVKKFIYYTYSFDKYKENKKNMIKKVVFSANNNFKDKIESAIEIAKSIKLARDMVNEPPNVMTAQKFLDEIKNDMHKKIKLEVMDEQKLIKEKLNLILGVNNGSKNKPYLLILKYMPVKKGPVGVMVGKGVTFDSGGINLKYGNFADMKTDMTGAAVVYSVINILAKNKIKKNVVALIPLVENMIGQTAIRPGDVIVSHSKKTVEITNTDAEGRLIMADCLSYCKKYKPAYVIDVATLTGSASSLFNKMSIAMMGNENGMQSLFEEKTNEENEKVWKLPFWEEYNKYLVSNVADLKNSADKVGGQIMIAGMFLYNFVPEDTNWLHLDIAGVSYAENSSKYNGATGKSINPIYEFVKTY